MVIMNARKCCPCDREYMVLPVRPAKGPSKLAPPDEVEVYSFRN